MLKLFAVTIFATMVFAAGPEPVSYINVYYGNINFGVPTPAYYGFVAPEIYHGSHPVKNFNGPVPVHGFGQPVFPVAGQGFLKEVFHYPVFFYIKSSKTPSKFSVYYAEKGFQSVFSDPHLKEVKDYVQTPVEKTSVIFYLNNFYNTKLYNTPIDKFVLPNDIKISDFATTQAIITRIPVFVFFEKDDFETYHFENVADHGKLAVYGDYIQPVH